MASQPVYLTKPPKKTSPVLIGCMIFVGLSVLISIISMIISSTSSSSSSTPPAPDTAAEDLRRRATEKLKQATDWRDPVVITRLCEQADSSALPADVKTKCGEAHLTIARERLKAGKVSEARQAYALASSEGAKQEALAAFEKPLKKAEEAEQKKQRELERAAGKIARKLYAEKLRERYLDQNMDIKVKVSGKDSDRLPLEFALFNDVWSHKFQKGDLHQEMRNLGFKRVDMTDGYDYHVYWTLK